MDVYDKQYILAYLLLMYIHSVIDDIHVCIDRYPVLSKCLLVPLY